MSYFSDDSETEASETDDYDMNDSDSEMKGPPSAFDALRKEMKTHQDSMSVKKARIVKKAPIGPLAVKSILELLKDMPARPVARPSVKKPIPDSDSDADSDSDPVAFGVKMTDTRSIWTSLGIERPDGTALSPREMEAEIEDILAPRATAEEMANPTPFISSLAEVLWGILGRVGKGKGNHVAPAHANRIPREYALAWACEIARYTPEDVQAAFVGNVRDLANVEWVDTDDCGVYWAVLRPLLPHQFWYDYVGSATGVSRGTSWNGLRRRRADRNQARAARTAQQRYRRRGRANGGVARTMGGKALGASPRVSERARLRLRPVSFLASRR